MASYRIEATTIFFADDCEEIEAVSNAFEQASAMYGSVFAKSAQYTVYKEE